MIRTGDFEFEETDALREYLQAGSKFLECLGPLIPGGLVFTSFVKIHCGRFISAMESCRWSMEFRRICMRERSREWK